MLPDLEDRCLRKRRFETLMANLRDQARRFERFVDIITHEDSELKDLRAREVKALTGFSASSQTSAVGDDMSST